MSHRPRQPEDEHCPTITGYTNIAPKGRLLTCSYRRLGDRKRVLKESQSAQATTTLRCF